MCQTIMNKNRKPLHFPPFSGIYPEYMPRYVYIKLISLVRDRRGNWKKVSLNISGLLKQKGIEKHFFLIKKLHECHLYISLVKQCYFLYDTFATMQYITKNCRRPEDLSFLIYYVVPVIFTFLSLVWSIHIACIDI